MAKKNTTPKESEEQIQFIAYCESRGIKAISTQNGMYIPKKSDDGKKDFNYFGYVNRQKKMGLAKGFPDLIILHKNKSGSQQCFFLELKRQEGGKLKTEQEEWIQWLDKQGYCVGIAHGCDAAIRVLNRYLES